MISGNKKSNEVSNHDELIKHRANNMNKLSVHSYEKSNNFSSQNASMEVNEEGKINTNFHESKNLF